MSSRLTGCLVLMLVCNCTFDTWATAQEPGEPKLVLSQERWDFGTLLHPQQTELTLQASNVGASELRITDIKSTCGCTVAKPEKQILAAGETTNIKIVFYSKGRQGPAESRITIFSNDQASPQRVFDITGIVQHAVEAHPMHGANFRLLDPSEARRQEIRLVNNLPEPMKPTLRPFSTDQFAAELKEIQPGREYLVTIAIQPPVKQKVLSDALVVLTGLSAEPELRLPALVVLMDRVDIRPPLLFVKLDKDKPKRQRLAIEYFGDDPDFKVLRATCADPHVSLEVGPPQQTRRQTAGMASTTFSMLQIEYPPSTVFPPSGLLFTIYTNDPEYSELTVKATDDQKRYQELTEELLKKSQRRSEKP